MLKEGEYAIYPQAETKGESNGWYDCPESEATIFVVEDKHGTLESFPSRTKAEDWVKHLKSEDSLAVQ